jgi:hypothetical protein
MDKQPRNCIGEWCWLRNSGFLTPPREEHRSETAVLDLGRRTLRSQGRLVPRASGTSPTNGMGGPQEEDSTPGAAIQTVPVVWSVRNAAFALLRYGMCFGGPPLVSTSLFR